MEKNKFVVYWVVICLLQGMNKAIFEKWHTTTKTQSFFWSVSGKPKIKSIEKSSQGHVTSGSNWYNQSL